MMTQPALAEAMTQIGPEVVTTSYVGQLENGRVRIPGQPFLRQLAGALGVSEMEILRISGVLSPEQAEIEQINPFPTDDRRWRIVEALKSDDPFLVEACIALVEHWQRSGMPVGGRMVKQS